MRPGTSKRVLRVLVAEDSPDDCELLLMELARGDYEVSHLRVETRDGMLAALAAQPWDLVLSDWSMPGFSALDALRVLRERNLDVPCIIASGTIGEELAVEALRNGACDFLVKDQLARLLPAVERELRETQLRREHDRMEEELLISDRLASVGMLASGVAHEINNPLAAVMSNLELALRDLETPGPLANAAEVIEGLADAYAAARRIRDIVRDLKLFSRAGDDSQVSLDVRRVLDSSLRMAHNEIRRRAELRCEYEPVPMIRANEARLGQVFLNLVVNAAHSIPEGRVEHNQIYVRTRTVPGRVVVEISDTGGGMEPDVIEQLFLPFFTTKAVGSGRGLGLSICHRIVSDLGGSITVESAVGTGSTFRVYLPAALTPAVPEPVAETPARAMRSKILIVDDEAPIARALGRALRTHDVVVLDRAADALDAIRTGARFDAILCDLMMPEMTGEALHAALLDLAPDQAAAMIFLTGGATTSLALEFLARVPNARLEKPFELSTLGALIDKHLGS